MSHRHGFTLIELLVATAVFVGLLLILIDGWSQSARATTQARRQAVALGIAREQMESLMSLPFDTPVGVPTGSRTASATVGGNVADATYSWQVNKSFLSGSTDQKSLQVSVTWLDGGVQHHVDLESMVCLGY